MYKDKDKQREANRQAQAKQRAKRIADGMTGLIKGMTNQGMTPKVEQGMTKPKRGKDIKCFVDLPLDVQQTIDKMSTTTGKLDKDEKTKRTAAAIKYQHIAMSLTLTQTSQG